MTAEQRIDNIRQIILDNQDYLFRIAYFRVGTRTDAEDIVQTAFMKFWEKAPRLKDARDIRLYLYRIVYNLCNDHSRYESASTVSLTYADNIADNTNNDKELHDEYQRISSLLALLPLTQRQVIEMHLMHDLTFVEISQMLKLPQTTLKSRFKSGIDKLRNKINEE